MRMAGGTGTCHWRSNQSRGLSCFLAAIATSPPVSHHPHPRSRRSSSQQCNRQSVYLGVLSDSLEEIQASQQSYQLHQRGGRLSPVSLLCLLLLLRARHANLIVPSSSFTVSASATNTNTNSSKPTEMASSSSQQSEVVE
jgi:hypothetical protein